MFSYLVSIWNSLSIPEREVRIWINSAFMAFDAVAVVCWKYFKSYLVPHSQQTRNKNCYSLYNVFGCLFVETVSMALLETDLSLNLLWVQLIQIVLLNLQPLGSLTNNLLCCLQKSYCSGCLFSWATVARI